MITKEIEIKVKTDKAEKSVKDLNSGLDGTDKKAKDAQKSSAGFGSTIDKATGGAVSKVKGLVTSLKGVTLGFRSIGVAIAASGIGLVLVAIAAITAAFKSSEEGQNKFAKLMAVIGTVVGNVTDILSDLGMFLIDLFSGDGDAMKALKDFGGQIFDIIGLPIKNIIDIAKTLGGVLGALFSGDIKGAFAELEQGVDNIKGNFVEAKDAAKDFYDGAVEGSKEFIKQQRLEIAIAQEIADQRANADKIERGLIVERAEANRKIAELRDKAARADLFNIAERKKALLDATAISDEITDKEIKAAKLRRDAIIEENKLSKSNKDALKAEEQAKAAVIELETKRLNLQKRLGTEIASLNNQQTASAKARNKALEAQTAKETAEEAKRLEKIEKLREKFDEKQRDLDAKTEEEKLELEASRAEEELELLVATEEEKREAQIALDKFYDNKRFELSEKRRLDKEAKEKEKRELEEEKRIESFNTEIENENLKFEERLEKLNEQQRLITESTTLSEEERTAALKANSEARVKIQQEEASAREILLKSISSTLQQAGDIAGKETEAGKALAVASALINTYQGISAGVALGFPQAIPAVLAAATVGFKSVKSILAVKTPKGGAGGGAGGNNIGDAGGVSGGGRQAAQPAFNLVGRSNVNQLQTGIEQQETAPVRAFVVSSNVTSQQEADRATQSQASFG